ncbi:MULTISPECIES: histone-like nucleoid-structuring protein, MvaT/MvaU family [Pseudomonas]|uniref:histone-like nucleoid-structuring protein, MvaT/MvaU family n=1 Tax=Pseudomonas TaxID=286 RepID=UPI0028A5CDE8|nr:histone-like nucleoid-structuring protein, MvaT/MvaU family [Pseudomonas sp.]
MSRLAEFRALELQLAAQLAELESLKNDGNLKLEMEFEEKLRDLLGEYGYSLKNIIAILDPQSFTPSLELDSPNKSNRKPRKVKYYKNPHSGELVETKGGNHKTLKDWKAKYGAEEVERWMAN